jgi:hypothetical protein
MDIRCLAEPGTESKGVWPSEICSHLIACVE